ncbi:MAG TPA: FG-GAP-like repeat-containing protein [Bryobacteraceae bacterium]|nr:FG-GAP-like repeat-containing protein [Bryobacteraceae bacterium]
MRTIASVCLFLLFCCRLAPADPCGTLAGLNGFITARVVNPNLNPNEEKLYNLAATAGGSNIFIVTPSEGSVYNFQLSTACAAELFQLQTAHAAFQLPASVPAAGLAQPVAGSSATAVADFNGDGNADLALVNPGGNSVIVYLGDSTGGVAAGTVYPVGNAPDSVALADVDGDGRLDLIVANHGGNTVSVLLGNGDGTFRAARNFAAGTGPAAIAIGDFNRDGLPDLAIGTQAYTGKIVGAVEVLLNAGGGTFGPPVEYASGSAPQSLVAADFNGDGILDLAVGDTVASQVRLLPGNMNGTFQAGGTVDVGGYPDYIVAADFNHDGKLDLAVLHGNAETISVVAGNGDGAFAAPSSYDAVYASAGFFPIGLLDGVGNSFPVGDFNGDGNLDILVYDGLSNQIRILFGQGDGTFSGVPAIPFGAAPHATFLAVADFSGSGKLDAITNDQLTDAIYYLAGQGDGGFAPPVDLLLGHTGPTNGVTAAAVGDFNRDGKPDLAVTGLYRDSVLLLLNAGSPQFAAPLAFSSGGPNPTGIAAADFDGDGNLDLALANSGVYSDSVGNLVLFKGDGHGNFTQTATFNSLGPAPAVVVAADLNGDGRPDLVVSDAGSSDPITDSGLYVLLNKGNGSFGAPTEYLQGTLPGSLAIGDLNGDGKPDLIVSNANGIGVMFGNGDGTLQSPLYTTTAFGAASIVVSDLNGDGIPDLVLGTCCAFTEVTYLAGNGDGTFQPPFYMSAGDSPSSVAVADLNGDGSPDLLVAAGYGGYPGSLIPILSTAAPQTFVTRLAAAGQIEPFAAESIVSAYGSGLAAATDTASTIPLPLSLHGTSVTVLDSAGVSHGAPLFYVSSTQVNFEIPAGTALGPARVTIANQNAGSQTAGIQIGAVSPGLFMLDSAGLVAAWVLPVISGAQQGLQPVYQVNSSGGVDPLPIDLSAPDAQYYLEIYGTGLRHARKVSATVGGVSVPVLYYGAAPVYAGLDQVNIGPLPASLAGQGSVTISVTADSQAANPASVSIQ